MPMPQIVMPRAPGAYDSDKVSHETGIDCSVEALKALIKSKKVPKQDILEAHQEFKDECDINKIVEKYDKMNAPLPMPDVASWNAACGDFTSGFDLHEAMNRTLEAQEAFMTLDARVRARFNNDPGQMLDFLNDVANRREAEELGLVAPGVGDIKGDSGEVSGAVPVANAEKPKA